MTQSLAEYAKEHPGHRGSVCWVCDRTETVTVFENGQERSGRLVDFINEGFRNGLYPAQIREWLINEMGYKLEDCTAPKLSSHKLRGHHEKKSA